GRYLERDDLNALRAHGPEDAADRAVLATGVGALQHHQHLESTIGVEDVLQAVELGRQCGDGLLVGRLAATRKRLVRWVEPAKVEATGGLRPAGAGESIVRQTGLL